MNFLIFQASKPLQESLGLPLDKLKVEHEKAALLPSPLYILYAKAAAYRDACGEPNFLLYLDINNG